jgi:hypothetical protein
MGEGSGLRVPHGRSKGASGTRGTEDRGDPTIDSA